METNPGSRVVMVNGTKVRIDSYPARPLYPRMVTARATERRLRRAQRLRRLAGLGVLTMIVAFGWLVVSALMRVVGLW